MFSRLAVTIIAVGLLGALDAAPTTKSPQPRPSRGPAAETSYVVASTDSAAGAYLTIVGSCNNCHTATWVETNGETPPANRLTGSSVGYRGPWGTSYPANLRILPATVTEDQWVQVLVTADSGIGRPPMPWMNTARMSQRDLRNLYRYVKALGPKGEPTPKPVAPGVEPSTPYVLLVPQQPGAKNTKTPP